MHFTFPFARVSFALPNRCRLAKARSAPARRSRWGRVGSLAIAAVLAIAAWAVRPMPATAAVDPTELAKAVTEIENLDALRSGLASTLEGRTEPPTAQTMREVCKPVGMQAMKLSKENGWKLRQVAAKYRNPAHAPADLHEKLAIAKFQNDPELDGFWEQAAMNDEPGLRYYRRINVEASCLACHGGKGDRPDFVKQNYPDDLAYDFEEGDLRGMYSVFIPDVKDALQQAL